MTGWYFAMFLYLVGWVALVDMTFERHDRRADLGWVVFCCSLWPLFVPIWMVLVAFRMACPPR